MADKLIPCIYWCSDGTTKQFLKMREIVQERNNLRKAAFEFLNEHRDDPECKHIVYYRDRRNDEDEVFQVHFYYAMRPWSDEEFYKETENLDGFVGAVHRQD